MGDHTFCIFSSLAMICRNIRQIKQICQILLISWSFEKTQLMVLWMPEFKWPHWRIILRYIFDSVKWNKVHTCVWIGNPIARIRKCASFLFKINFNVQSIPCSTVLKHYSNKIPSVFQNRLKNNKQNFSPLEANIISPCLRNVPFYLLTTPGTGKTVLPRLELVK